MKTIGLIGGMSWESSAEYYRILNQEVRRRLGGTHSASVLLYSFDFAEVERLQHAGDWTTLTAMMIGAAERLAAGGADMVLLCTNTMHLMADAVAAAVPIPLLHIADPAGEVAVAAGHRRVALIGTAFTMEQDFYRRRLGERFGLDVIIPEPEERAVIHRVIYEELVAGRVLAESRAAYRRILMALVGRGAEAAILGCTEIMLLVDQSDCTVPLIDTTSLHAVAAVERALG
jgi:aspartate racemase